MITLLIIILMVFLILVFSITPKRNHLTQEIMESQETLAELTYLIQQKQQILTNQPTINHFTQSENRVLDLYDQSNIRLPLDILEDLSALSFLSENEIFDFIENQRNYWKLENQKKPYKKPTE